MPKPTITPLELATIKELHKRYLNMTGEGPGQTWDQKTYHDLVGLLLQNTPALVAAAEEATIHGVA